MRFKQIEELVIKLIASGRLSTKNSLWDRFKSFKVCDDYANREEIYKIKHRILVKVDEFEASQEKEKENKSPKKRLPKAQK